ncbi:MAG: xanthine dehydrogenase family protein molybdopterin-binding subunit, partial [Stellaceae bacterium]
TVLWAPVDNGAPDTVDASGALAVPGVLKVMPLHDGVGVVAETVEAAFAGRDALKATWKPLPADRYSSAAGLKEFLARAAKTEDKGASFLAKGDADQAFAKAAKVVSADYSSAYVYHAQMEPLNVTASVDPKGGGAEVWIGTQGVTPTVLTTAGVLKIKPQDVKIHPYYLGGGYGRRSPADWVPDALFMSKAMQRPIKLIWTREQDVKSAKMRPMTAHRIEAALDGDGNVVGWRHRIVGESVVAYRGGEKALEHAKGIDGIVLEGSKHEYAVPNQAIAYLREERGVGLSAWRGIGAGYNKFVIESFIDELATERKVDPVAFRLGLLKSEPRATAVVK